MGSVEVQCLPGGLAIWHERLTEHPAKGAPPRTTAETGCMVPWETVSARRQPDARLLLRVDSTLTPFAQLCLGEFRRADIPGQARRSRGLVLRLASAGLLGLGALGAWRAFPEALGHVGVWTAVGLAAAGSAVLFVVGLAVDLWLEASRDRSPQLVDEFIEDLDRFLRRRVAPAPEEAPPSLGRRFRRHLPSLLLGSSLAAVAAAVVGVVIGVVKPDGLRRLDPISAELPPARSVEQGSVALRPTRVSPTEAQSPAERAPETRQAAAAPAQRAPAPGAAAQGLVHPPPEGGRGGPPPVPPSGNGNTPQKLSLGEDCTCARAESPLWARPIPRLSALVLSAQTRTDQEAPRTELQVAAVNNGDQLLSDLELTIVFRQSGRDEGVRRYVHFDGPLRPGHAIKWDVVAPGDDFDVVAPDFGSLDPRGTNTAPEEALTQLTLANHRPVRLHAARLLAFRGSESARRVAEELGAARRAEERAYLQRLTTAVGPVITCAVEVDGTKQVKACAYNRGDAPQASLEAHLSRLAQPFRPERPTAAPPAISSSFDFALAGPLPPRSGRTIRIPVDRPPAGDEAPAFELVVRAAEASR